MSYTKRFDFGLLIMLMTACSPTVTEPRPSSVTINQSEAALTSQIDEIRDMQKLVEQSLVFRSKAIQFYQAHTLKEEQLGHEIPLTSAELSNLYDEASAYLDIREKLKTIALKYSWLTNPHYQVIFSAQGKAVSKAETAQTFALPKDRESLDIDIVSPEGQLLMLQLKASLGAALVLYDNYLMAIYPFTQNKKFSYLFNHDFESYLNDEANKYTDRNTVQKLQYKIASLTTVTGKLDELTDSYLNGSQREKIVASMQILDGYNQAVKPLPNHRVSNEETYLDLLREQSYTYNYIRKTGDFGTGNARYLSHLEHIQDNLQFFNDAFTFIVSEGFGNSIGLVAFREGKLKSLPAVEKQAIADKLQPLDILLEKTPFRLTDAFIPGHYGHVAVWVGRYSDFEKLGLADHPLVKKYEKQLKNGQSIVEALRPGVQMNSLEHFLNIDDLAVFRPKDLSLAEQREFLLRALKQVGKEYDFNFNVETDEAIVCSELAYVVFTNVGWPTEKNLGRFTISPDHIAQKALDGTFDTVLIYHDGKKVDGDLHQTLSVLLKASPALGDKLAQNQ